MEGSGTPHPNNEKEDSDMSISFDDALSISGVSAVQPVAPIQPPPPPTGEEAESTMKIGGGERDSYIPSSPMFDGPMPSGTYGRNGMMMGDFSSIQDSSPAEPMDVSSLDTTISEMQESAAEDIGSDFMSMLSDALRANTESIERTMEELGMTAEDLTNQEKVSSLVNAMNQGAENLGVPQITDIDKIIESIMNAADEQESGSSSTITTYSFSDFGLPNVPSVEEYLLNRTENSEKAAEEVPNVL